MPVDVSDDEPDAIDHRWVNDPDSNPHRIVSFLAANPGTSFTPTEIVGATDVPRGSVGATLSRLEALGLVRHSDSYWAIVEDGRLAPFEAMVVDSRETAGRADPGWVDLDTDAFASEAEMDAWRDRQGDGGRLSSTR
jgi:DNA-binding transcriptional ArsR family regulator